MKPRYSCQAVIDEYILDKELEALYDLTVDNFNLCMDCTTVVADACVECGGGVHVLRGETTVPDYCPARRADPTRRTGSDPGWTCDAVLTWITTLDRFFAAAARE